MLTSIGDSHYVTLTPNFRPGSLEETAIKIVSISFILTVHPESVITLGGVEGGREGSGGE